MLRTTRAIAVLLCTLFVADTVFCQSSDYTFNAPNVDGDERVVATIQFDNLGGNVGGFSMGVCSTPSLVLPVTAEPGSDVVAVNPDFVVIDLEGGGVTYGMIVDFMSVEVFPVGFGLEVLDIEYSMLGAPGEVSPLTICTLGTPVVLPWVVVEMVSITPTTTAGSITIVATDPNPHPPIDPPPTGSGDYSFELPTFAADERADVTVLFDNGGSLVRGWSMSICSDENDLYPISANMGADTVALNPDFWIAEAYSDGVLNLCLVSFLAGVVLPVGDDLEILDVEYSLVGPVGSAVEIAFCDTVGIPETDTLLVEDLEPIVPELVNGLITINSQDSNPPGVPPHSGSGGGGGPIDPPTSSDLVMDAGNHSIDVDPATGAANFSVDLLFSDASGATITQGFSFGLAHPETALQATNVVAVNALAALAGGVGPDYFEATLFADGVTLGTVYSFLGAETITIDAPASLVSVAYQTNAAELIGFSDSVDAALTWTETLGTPLVTNIFISAGVALDPAEIDGNVELNPVAPVAASQVPFRRGDANNDGLYDIADTIYLLSHLFESGAEPPCAAAADINADGGLDIGDPIFALTGLFDGGADPSAPFAACGVEPNPDRLPCDEFDNCP